MKSPKVTVLMPVYNGEKYLREAIESILNQTFKDFEFLIINDGSTDKSVEIIESFKDTRIRLVHNEKNIKLIARGEYIARMDCDDISLSERLQEQVNYLFANPQINVLGTGFQTINQKGEILEDIVYFPDSEKIIAWDLLFYCPIAHPTVMMRKKIIKEIGGYLSESDIYEKKNLYVEDYYLWSKLNNIKEFTITNISKVLLKLRKHGDNITSIYLDENKKNSALISYENMKRYFDIDITEEFIYSIVFNQLNQCEVIKSLN
ncbi:MAG: glycosyltransferase, partial [Spirochaetota bacterium]|nr:glycosyltransferase [Spirochaetota bacterium]